MRTGLYARWRVIFLYHDCEFIGSGIPRCEGAAAFWFSVILLYGQVLSDLYILPMIGFCQYYKRIYKDCKAISSVKKSGKYPGNML